MDSQSLCLACGLCCDGTLFGQAHLSPQDDMAALLAAGAELVSDPAKSALKLPCTAYRNCACSIYSDRPHVCRQFQCRLLRRFKVNEISEGDALDIIRQAIALRDNVKQQMRTVFGEDDCNFDTFTPRFRSLWNASSADAKANLSGLFQSFAALWLCISKYFRSP
jgi:uncharacterized protein